MTYKRLPLETLVNARDLGGFPLPGGVATQFGRFIRSELPERINEHDKKFLKDYGVTTSVDFRGSFEITESPSTLRGEDWLRYIHNPLWSIEAAHGKPQLPAVTVVAEEIETEHFTEEQKAARHRRKHERRLDSIEWIAVYIAMAEENKDWVRKNFELFAETEGCIHYHCMTGKDRTGIFTAMLLKAARAADDDVIADYSVSQIYLRPFYQVFREGDPAFPGDPDLTLSFYITSPDTMRGFLDHIHGAYGNMRKYLKSCGLTEKVIDNALKDLI
ncbi:MAG: tyrosine-protein phosphatase [Oscillospiraceae bacterium]|jgi:protein-tyrosine phosphatase|nr:tyrosine-protein phosphatase [Oscillospiraceae bacterium]